MLFAWIRLILSITLVDALLSASNILALATSTSLLYGRERRLAVFLGSIAAIILRIIFTISISIVLNIPYLKFIGGIVVFFIAFQLIRDIDRLKVIDEDNLINNQRNRQTLLSIIAGIAIGDLSLSIDNILSIAAVADGNDIAIIAGLCLSIFILTTSASIVGRILERFPILTYLVASVQGWTAGVLILEESRIQPILNSLDRHFDGISFSLYFPLLLTGIMVFAGLFFEMKRRQKSIPVKAFVKQ